MVSIEMEHFTHIDSARDELAPCGVDVRDHEKHSLSGARHRCRGQVDRARRSGRCELYCSKGFPDHEIGVEPPPQSKVEGLGAVNVGYRDRDGLEFQIDARGVRNAGGGLPFSADLRIARGVLLWPPLS